eukprot:2862289-Alexandrium_andersonii.AAC.1
MPGRCSVLGSGHSAPWRGLVALSAITLPPSRRALGPLAALIVEHACGAFPDLCVADAGMR